MIYGLNTRSIIDYSPRMKRDNSTPRIILVSGLRASGKSTIAKLVASNLNYTLISQDEIKERLYDEEVAAQKLHLSELPKKTFHVMYKKIELHLGEGKSIVVDSVFKEEIVRGEFAHLLEKVQFKLMVIQILCNGAALRERFVQRMASRHAAHQDFEWLKANEQSFFSRQDQELRIGDLQIKLNTENFDEVDVHGLLSTCREF